EAVAALPAHVALEIVHQAGERMHAEAVEAYARAGVAADVRPFIADMAQAYADADLVICRAGALTLAELCAAGVGSLLVPFPAAVDDHQTKNAHYLVERGAARLLPQRDGLAADIAAAIEQLADRVRLLELAEAARAIARPQAAAQVADIVIEHAGAQPARLEPTA
ncbi:MAG TPA: glycosyltransferase, partial [Lysobacter sp.]